MLKYQGGKKGKLSVRIRRKTSGPLAKAKRIAGLPKGEKQYNPKKSAFRVFFIAALERYFKSPRGKFALCFGKVKPARVFFV